jgi:ComF family protein
MRGLVRRASARDKCRMAIVSALMRSALDFALPPRCAGCGVIVSGDRELCVTCWGTLDFLTGDGCQLCGCPSVADGLICAPCLAHPPAHDGAHAAVAYGDLARSIVLKFKHGGRIGLARLAAAAMGRHLPDPPYLLIPVPLHRWRIWNRGFNQSALMAQHLAHGSGQPFGLDVLVRAKATPLLRGLGAKARAEAVRGVFAVDREKAGLLKGRTVVLVDDVYTSGATSNACARALKKAGAGKVIILCWARVLIDD